MAESPAHPSRPATFRSVFLRAGVVLGAFALVNVTSGLVLDAARDRCGARENGVINNGRRAQAAVLVLGTSRAKHHYDDALLTKLWGAKVFNAGYGGQGIPFARVALDLIAQRAKPRVVILDVAAFGDDIDRAHALDPWYFESPVLRGLPAPGADPMGASADSDAGYGLLMRMPLYRYAGQAKHTLQDAREPYSDSGYASIPVPAAIPAFERNPRWREPDRWLESQLDGIVRQCRETGATLILTVTPTKTDDTHHPVFRPAEAYARRHGLPFVDFNERDYPELHRDELFVDEVHMTVVGSELFTRELARKLRPLLPNFSKP